MNALVQKENISIEDKIYEIRGIYVMLDSDLGKIFKIETGNINKAMKRNIERFPQEFCFQLTIEEYNSLLFQIGIAKKKGGRTNLPYAYSEQGVAMLSSVLHSDIAISMSIQIINAFVKMRHFLMDNRDIYKSLNYINNKVVEHDDKLNCLFSKFDKSEQLFLENNEYDAYSSFVSIFKLANDELIIVDSYADNTLLDIIRKLKCRVILITKNSDRLRESEIDKYNKEYNNLIVVRNNSFHDRYYIIDKKEIYHSGTSINNAGKKIFSINKIEDEFAKKTIIDKVIELI